MQEDDILSKIKYLTVRKRESGTETSVEATKPRLLEKLKILDDLKFLVKGRYDLTFVGRIEKTRPKAKTRCEHNPYVEISFSFLFCMNNFDNHCYERLHKAC